MTNTNYSTSAEIPSKSVDREGRENRLHSKSRADPSRRQFLGLLGAGATAGIGFPETANAQETPVVTMGDTYFDPIGLYVKPGTTVRFEIKAGSHSATAYEDRIPSEASMFDSGVISEGRFEYTFNTPGTYDYYCIPHQSMGMLGRIVVGEPGGPAEDSSIPDGVVPESETIVDQGAISVDEFDESDGGAGGGMMGSEMMNGGSPGWMILMPLGFLIAVLGVVGSAVYWVFRWRNSGTTGDGSALAGSRERHAYEELNQKEYAERKRQVQQGEQHDE